MASVPIRVIDTITSKEIRLMTVPVSNDSNILITIGPEFSIIDLGELVNKRVL
jgi:hypothetical protein